MTGARPADAQDFGATPAGLAAMATLFVLKLEVFADVFALLGLCHAAGSISARLWIGRMPPTRLAVLAGAVILTGGIGLAGTAPIALAAFAGSHSYPVLVAATIDPFPQDEGSAAALLGGMQMGAGFVVARVGAALPGAAPAALSGSLLIAGGLAITWASCPPIAQTGGTT